MVKALGTNKTLGQYGYIAEFFKKSWNIEKDDLVRVFQECFGNFDEKYIFLIPKGIDAWKVGDFRLISLNTLLYKIIARVSQTNLRKFYQPPFQNTNLLFCKEDKIWILPLLPTK